MSSGDRGGGTPGDGEPGAPARIDGWNAGKECVRRTQEEGRTSDGRVRKVAGGMKAIAGGFVEDGRGVKRFSFSALTAEMVGECRPR